MTASLGLTSEQPCDDGSVTGAVTPLLAGVQRTRSSWCWWR